MRKYLRYSVSILVLLSFLLASCSPAEISTSEPQQSVDEQPADDQKNEEPAVDQPKEKITLTVEMSVYVEAPHKKAFDMLKEAYEAENPNIEIVYYGPPYAEFWDKLTTEIVAGTEADIVQLQASKSYYAQYASLREGETGAFVNLDKWIKGTNWEEDLMDQKNLTYNGHYIGFSNYAWGARGIYYRKSLFEKAGIDPNSIITTEDFLEAAKKLTVKGENGQPDQYGFGAVISTHPFVWDEMKWMVCRPIGGTYTPENKPPYEPDNITVNNDEMKWCWQWWQDMIFNEQIVPPGSYDKADERDLFWNGTVAMNIDGPWFVGMTREKDPELLNDLGVFASPDVLYNGETYPYHGEISSITHLISTNCEHPEEAWKFLEWMAGEEAQKIVAVSGMIPANTKYANSDDYKALEPLNAELTLLVNDRYVMPAAVDPNIPEMGEIKKVMLDAAQAAFITGANVSDLLDSAAEQIKSILTQ